MDEEEVRRSFWDSHPKFLAYCERPQNSCPADVRVAFVEYVDFLARDGQITERTAQEVTL